MDQLTGLSAEVKIYSPGDLDKMAEYIIAVKLGV